MSKKYKVGIVAIIFGILTLIVGLNIKRNEQCIHQNSKKTISFRKTGF